MKYGSQIAVAIIMAFAWVIGQIDITYANDSGVINCQNDGLCIYLDSSGVIRDTSETVKGYANPGDFNVWRYGYPSSLGGESTYAGSGSYSRIYGVDLGGPWNSFRDGIGFLGRMDASGNLDIRDVTWAYSPVYTYSNVKSFDVGYQGGGGTTDPYVIYNDGTSNFGPGNVYEYVAKVTSGGDGGYGTYYFAIKVDGTAYTNVPGYSDTYQFKEVSGSKYVLDGPVFVAVKSDDTLYGFGISVPSGTFDNVTMKNANYWCGRNKSNGFVECYDSSGTKVFTSSFESAQPPISGPSNSCEEPIPDFPNVGTLKYEPVSVNQTWVYSSGSVESCSYSCTGGYSGSGCSTPPPSCYDGIKNQDETDIDTGGVCGYDYVPTDPIPTIKIDATCGTASKNYSYTGSSFQGEFCGAGTLSGSSVSFPEQGQYSNWTCLGSGSGSNATCYAYRYTQPNSCASPVPNYENLGNLKYSPVSVNQSWVYDTGATLPCSYSCAGGYSGEGCAITPNAPSGADTSIWSAIFKPISDMTAKFTEFYNWVKTAFEIVDIPGNVGIDLGTSGDKFGGTFNMTNKIVALGAERVSETMNVNGTQCAKYMVLPNGSNETSTGLLIVHTKKSHLVGGRFNCYNYAWTDEEYDLSKMVVNGKFTYMKDAFGNDVSASNAFTIKTDFKNDVRVNTGFDVKVFGYSIISEPLSKFVGLVLDTLVYVLNFVMGLGSNFLDLFSMGTLNYGGENYGPFFYSEGYPDDGFGKIAYAGGLWSYFSTPKTKDNYVLDVILLGLTGWYITRKYWKKG